MLSLNIISVRNQIVVEAQRNPNEGILVKPKATAVSLIFHNEDGSVDLSGKAHDLFYARMLHKIVKNGVAFSMMVEEPSGAS